MWRFSRKEKPHYRQCSVIDLVIVSDKRLINPLVCHQAHMLVTYQYADQRMSDTILFDHALYERFKSGQSCQILAASDGVIQS
ncbi:hypothetical protein CWB99_16805 [Pseudoalteromonas rubra]|uniref:Uncharacterized protein n=1 Tax=Pseudoalteromonas rubra TaxID=43658 RepID=A0A5S3WJA4_9GAMM|nr:hypothetical protein [Pseudoalteromonas rubra]TMP26961.1 hypothetical protein CWB99_16805 [Pseudoalteromonas rubra]TMP27679.1 hypothetical protein CWC00_23000 [Pseudoalteromonas rubra]